MALLEINKVRKEYLKGNKKVEALRGVTITIEKGEFLSIVGPSGSGKSTLLNIIGCLDTASSGSVLYNGRELGGLSEQQLRLPPRQHRVHFSIIQPYSRSNNAGKR